MKSDVFRGFGRGALLLAVLALVPSPATAGDGLDSLQGGFAFVGSEGTRGMKEFPRIEALTPVPSFYKPSEQAEIVLFCESEVSNKSRAVRQAKGSFVVELYLLDHKTGRFETFVVGTGKTRTDTDGSGSFHVSVSMTPFADRLQSAGTSAWLRTHGSFATKKGDSAGLVCYAATSG